jgi:GxxExxY protein
MLPSTPRLHQISHMEMSESLTVEIDQMARSVVDCAFTVHKELGPGLLESVYQACFGEELKSRGIPYRRQVSLPIKYRTLRLDSGLRLDLLVSDSIIVELKSVARMEPIFKAQLLSYLQLSGLKLGFLINFNVPLIREGIYRVVL